MLIYQWLAECVFRVKNAAQKVPAGRGSAAMTAINSMKMDDYPFLDGNDFSGTAHRIDADPRIARDDRRQGKVRRYAARGA
jgi:hypothetical protein